MKKIGHSKAVWGCSRAALWGHGALGIMHDNHQHGSQLQSSLQHCESDFYQALLQSICFFSGHTKFRTSFQPFPMAAQPNFGNIHNHLVGLTAEVDLTPNLPIAIQPQLLQNVQQLLQDQLQLLQNVQQINQTLNLINENLAGLNQRIQIM